MVRCAKEFGLKARKLKINWTRLASTPLPAIAVLKDGGFLLLGKVGDDKVVVQSTKTPRPELMTKADLEAVWDGPIVLMTRRANLTDLSAASTSHGSSARFTSIANNWPRFSSHPSSSVVCAHLAVILSGGHRQSSGPSQHWHARRAGNWAARDSCVRDHPWNPSDLPFFACHQPDRRRTWCTVVPTFAGIAYSLFSGPPGWRFGRAGTRTGEHSDILDQLGADTCDRSVLHLRFPRGDVPLFAAINRDRPCWIPILRGDFRRGDAAVSPATRREVQARRTEPGFPGGKRRWG